MSFPYLSLKLMTVNNRLGRMMSSTPIREQLWSPVQNTSLWLGWWLHGLLPTDQVIDAFQDVQGPAHTLVVDEMSGDPFGGRFTGRIETLRAEGLKVGLFRPITLWPFPEEALRTLSKSDHVKAFLDVEMSSCGQMIDDVRLSVEGRKPIHYLGHAGGVMPTVEEMVDAAKAALKEGK